MSLTKHTLSCEASSAHNGGTRRVFTSPLRGAFTMTANAYFPAWGDKPVGTLTSFLTQRVEGALAPRHASTQCAPRQYPISIGQMPAIEPRGAQTHGAQSGRRCCVDLRR